jgi:hypothetical protein
MLCGPPCSVGLDVSAISSAAGYHGMVHYRCRTNSCRCRTSSAVATSAVTTTTTSNNGQSGSAPRKTNPARTSAESSAAEREESRRPIGRIGQSGRRRTAGVRRPSLQIASNEAEYELYVMTRNTADFAPAGVMLVNLWNE